MAITPKQTGAKKPDINAVEAAVQNLSKEFIEIKKAVDAQRSESRNVIIGAILAVIFLVAAVAVEILIFNKQAQKDYSELDIKYAEKINILERDSVQNESEHNLRYELLKAKNPYLK